ncbi:hypothetical protein KW797_04595 [Candidatus Parcubacteria bacterium]|nr:hypothetical protein [Candidatus Parcubacteria bacterium]
MPKTSIILLNGSKCETEIPLDELYILYKSVAQKRATILIQAYWGDKEGGLDLRRLDPDATFTPPVIAKEPVAA